MAKFEVKNSEGKKVAEAELAAEVYGIEPNIHVMHHIVKSQMASWRQGPHSAKGRSEVSGGGKKPWRRRAPAVPARFHPCCPVASRWRCLRPQAPFLR